MMTFPIVTSTDIPNWLSYGWILFLVMCRLFMKSIFDVDSSTDKLIRMLRKHTHLITLAVISIVSGFSYQKAVLWNLSEMYSAASKLNSETSSIFHLSSHILWYNWFSFLEYFLLKLVIGVGHFVLKFLLSWSSWCVGLGRSFVVSCHIYIWVCLFLTGLAVMSILVTVWFVCKLLCHRVIFDFWPSIILIIRLSLSYIISYISTSKCSYIKIFIYQLYIHMLLL